jgi:NAD(P)-dependent dehydrogenase (short-subunit alcohol dehydrogenase family)
MVVSVAATLRSIPADDTAVVIGATGGIGRALVQALQESSRFSVVLALSRSSNPSLDLESEASICDAAQHAASRGGIRFVIDATGLLHGGGVEPEKSWRGLDASHMAKAFAVNAIGPALLMKHFLPLLPRTGKSVFATLSAKVGSIGDNRLGGWYSYRASKAALNQLVRTAAIELKRSHPEALCVAIHPGTTDTSLSARFSKAGLAVQTPKAAAAAIVACLDGLGSDASGGFFDRTSERLPW